MSKEPAKRDRRDDDQEVQARRARGESGNPNPEDFEKGEYHGLTPQQIKKIEDARYDDTGPGGTAPEPEADRREKERREKERREEEARHDKKHQ